MRNSSSTRSSGRRCARGGCDSALADSCGFGVSPFAPSVPKGAELTSTNMSNEEKEELSEEIPSFAADRRMGRHGNPVGRGLSSALPLELHPDGRRDSNPQPMVPKEPLPAHQADSTFKVRDNRIGIVGCEARVRTRNLRIKSPFRGSPGSVFQCCDLRVCPPAVPLVTAFPLRVARIAGWIVGCVHRVHGLATCSCRECVLHGLRRHSSSPGGAR